MTLTSPHCPAAPLHRHETWEDAHARENEPTPAGQEAAHPAGKPAPGVKWVSLARATRPLAARQVSNRAGGGRYLDGGVLIEQVW